MAAPNALVAAAQVLTGIRSQDPARQHRAWQDEAWQFYDETGPLRYATNWLANLISRARLQAATLSPSGDEPEPIETGQAADAVESLAGGVNGQSQMLRSSVVDLTVPGIGYLVGQGTDTQTWRMYSADVLRMRSPATDIVPAVYELAKEDGKWEVLPSESTIVRIWRPHERFYWEPDSPARAALGDLRELRRIRQYIDATLVSRLAGAGVLLIPQEVSYPTAPNEPDAPHPFITEVIDVMMTAVREPGTAAAVVPIPIEVPAEHADAFKHLSFHTELSDKILDMRESALRQCAITLDVPAEVLTGMGDLNHWGAWQIEESAVKIHAEPLLELITSALTTGFLHPVLTAQGMDKEEAAQYVIWADTSELSSKPDKSDDAVALYDRGEASGVALRRETGLSEADKPNDEELADWAYKKAILAGSETITLGMEGLGIDVPEPPAPPPVVPVSNNGSQPGADEPEDNEQGPPDIKDARDEGFDARVLVLESYVHRALERAGNRIRSTHRASLQDCGDSPHACIGGVEDAEGYLIGAWDRLRPLLPEMGMDPVITIERLHSYCCTLLAQGLEYERDSMTHFVRVW